MIFGTKNSVEYIIVGLGNIGSKYDNTRHNVGFVAVDTLAKKIGTPVNRIKFKATTALVTVDTHKCLLVKPATYMNNSGEAVSAAMSYYKVPLERVIVIYDDISLEPSKIRIRNKGSDGGHNGIKSIITLCGSDTFPRVKIGVGKKPHPDYDLADWVLSTFKKEESALLTQTFNAIPEIISLMVDGKTEAAMNKFNR